MTTQQSLQATVTLDRALGAHRAWKSKLQHAVKSGEVLDVELIRRDDCCDLGKWLYSNGKQLYGHAPQFSLLLQKHGDFHLVASIVADVINTKDYEQAIHFLQSGSQFESASTEVALAILNLKKAVAGIIP